MLRDRSTIRDFTVAGPRGRGAMALALDAPYLPPNSSFAMSGRYGNFEGASAVSLSGAIRVSRALQFDAGLAYGVSHGNLGGTVGFTLNW